MQNLTIRTRIVAAFSLIIAIMVALGVVSHSRLQTIRAEAMLLETDDRRLFVALRATQDDSARTYQKAIQDDVVTQVALSRLSVAAQQAADSLRQSNMAIEQLNGAARGLQSGVSRFTLAS